MSGSIANLRPLGVGLAADVSASQPNFRVFIGEQATDKIDYYNFGAHYVQERRVRHYIDDLVRAKMPMVFHPINFNVALPDPEPVEVLERTVAIAEYTNAVWAAQDVGVWVYGGQYLGSFLIPPVLDRQSVRDTVTKVKMLNAALPCPFLVENPPVGFSFEAMHMMEFMSEVADRADCGLVLDVGHLIGYQRATRRGLDQLPVESFPWDRIVEVHMAGLQFSKVGDDTNIIDQHAYPVHELCWAFLEEHIDKLCGLKGLTLEQEYCPEEQVRHHLRRARRLVSDHAVF